MAFLLDAHPIKTARAVEAATGVPARTVERWLTLDAQPSLGAFARLVAAYGPAFLAACVPGLGWVERAAARAGHEAVAAEIERLTAHRDALAARLRGAP